MGDRFGRFDVLRVLGRGGMSWTCLGELQGPRGFRKRLAIKRLHESLLSSDEARARFDAEARVCGLLEHNNIVRAYEYGDVGNEPYLAFELVQGLTLSRVLAGLDAADRKMAIGASVHLGRSIASALSYAHRVRDPNGRAVQIVHRDLNSSNTLISWNGEVKVADFGVARHTPASLAAIPGAIRGRFAYMAPEQAGQAPSMRGQMYSASACCCTSASRGRARSMGGHGRRVARSSRARHPAAARAAIPDTGLPVGAGHVVARAEPRGPAELGRRSRPPPPGREPADQRALRRSRARGRARRAAPSVGPRGRSTAGGHRVGSPGGRSNPAANPGRNVGPRVSTRRAPIHSWIQPRHIGSFDSLITPVILCLMGKEPPEG
ncbi:MAG: serine/threonine protein kinase [Proteobacteria bacterium]|nr:serine/threonine protein kinase [Pseudomonadota bacterium]